MPLYRYQAITNEGKKTFGVINADSYEIAKETLQKQKILVIKLFSFQGKSKQLVLPQALLVSFTRDLAQLLRAGLPLYESLMAIEEKYRSNKAHPLLLDLCDKVKSGMHLSDALGCYPKVFDQIYISMISTAEETGSLAKVFTQLEKLILRQQKLKKQLVSAMIYPMFLMGFCFVVINALFFFLIPSMEQLFEERTLHPFTAVIIAISKFLRNNGPVIGITLALVIVGCAFYFTKQQGKLFLQKMYLKIPILNTMITQAVLVRFCRGLSIMLLSSVSLLEALKLSKGIMKNPFFEKVISNVEKKVEQGGKLSEELLKSPLIPSLVTRMLTIAEETGNVSEMLESIADIYEEELERSLARFTTLLQPVMLLFLAVVVGIVILSILLPLTDVGSFLNT